jgi:osmotically-inducible protein OsmY
MKAGIERVGVAAILFALAIGLQAPYILSHDSASQQTAPDNTRKNKTPGPTADQQKETKADRELAQKIRKAVVADKSLSTYAHNVKIVAMNGTVTLRGPVRSEQEKSAIEATAAAVAGVSQVKNELEVVPKR